MKSSLDVGLRSLRWTFAGTITSAMALSMLAIFLFAPEEVSMGDVQRIVYLHVSVAWCGLVASIAMGVFSSLYLLRRDLHHDQWALASAETGFLCTTLTLITGSLWAHEAWNTWWTWEPRLTSALILWTIYAGYFLVRGSLDRSDARARVSSIFALLAVLDLPLVIMATRWFRGIHPVSPEMEPRMRIVLLLTVASFMALFCTLIVFRRKQLHVAERVARLESVPGNS